MNNQLQTVSFAGTDLFIVNQAGKPFVPMRQVVEGMGMAWQSQHEKLKTKFSTCVTEIVMQLPNDTQTRAVTCLPLAKIAGWLYSVSPNKVAPEIREKVIQYQNECDTALFDYWTKGVAVKPSEGATPEQSQHIKHLVNERVRTTNKAYAYVWNEVFDAGGFNKLDRLTDAAYHRAVALFTDKPAIGTNEITIEKWKVIDLNNDIQRALSALEGIAARVNGIGILKSDLPDTWWKNKRLAG